MAGSWGRILRVIMGLIALGFTSCQKGDSFCPVRGQVLVNGMPAEGATVVFHPQDESDPPLLPSGVVAADGSFELQSWLVEDRVLRQGAPPGEYRVTCVWQPSDLGENLPDKLQGKYSDSRGSGLQASVHEGPNELPPFQLQTP
jgi:hypothetical protein